jgi:hypothetical protein
MSFMPNNNRVITPIEAPRTVLRVYDLHTNPTTNPLNQTAGTGAILRVHDLNNGSIQVIQFNRNNY